MKKLISLLLSVTMLLCTAVSLVACGDDDDGKTVLNITVQPGGLGQGWLTECADRFVAEIGDKSYADGKNGVKINITPSWNPENSIASDGYALVHVTAEPVNSTAPTGNYYNIDDWMTEANPWNADGSSIDSYLNDTAKNIGKYQGEYYAAPAWSWYGGLWYDSSLWKDGNYYLADVEAGQGHDKEVIRAGVNLGNLYLVNDASSKKSCGRDGIYGTEDDGLPTSLLDFLRLCCLMKDDNVDVITVTGKYSDQIHYLLAAMWGGLASYEELYATIDFQGKVVAVELDDDNQVVTNGLDMFNGAVPGIKDVAPGVQTKEVTVIRDATQFDGKTSEDENWRTEGFNIFNTAARYYAQTMFQLFKRFDLYVDIDQPNITHTDAQLNFMSKDFQEKPRAFLSEASYFYSESKEVDNFNSYIEASGDADHIQNDIKWFPMPVTLNEPIEPQEDQTAEPYKYGLIQIGGESGGFMINNAFANDPEKLAAVKDFFQFMLSKEELANHTISTGNTMPYSYELTDEQYKSLNSIQQSVWDMQTNALPLTTYPTDAVSTIWLKYPNTFSLNTHDCYHISGYKTGGGIQGMKSLYKVVQAGWSAEEIFNYGVLSQASWSTTISQVYDG